MRFRDLKLLYKAKICFVFVCLYFTMDKDLCSASGLFLKFICLSPSANGKDVMWKLKALGS